MTLRTRSHHIWPLTQALRDTLGAAGGTNRAVQLVAEADGGVDAVALRVVGLRHRLGQVRTVLPQLPGDALVVPQPYTMAVLHRPRPRPPRAEITRFKVYTVREPTAEEAAAKAAAEEAAAAAADPKAKKPAKGKVCVCGGRWRGQ